MATNLRGFRHSVAVLKKRGIVSGTTQAGLKLDARWASPKTKVNGKSLASIVKKYSYLVDAVDSGKASVLKVRPSTLRKLPKGNYQKIGKDRILVSHSKGERAKVSGGNVTVYNDAGIERVEIPIAFENIPDYLKKLKRNKRKIDAMKKNNEWFGIRFFGNHRATVYRDIGLLLEDLVKYEAFNPAPKSRAKNLELFEALEIIKIKSKKIDPWFEESENRKRGRSQEYNRKQAKRYREKLNWPQNQGKKDRVNKATAERMKAYRQRVKSNPKAYKKTKKERLKSATKWNKRNRDKKK